MRTSYGWRFFASLTAVVFGVAKGSDRQRIVYGLKVFGEFLVIALFLAGFIFSPASLILNVPLDVQMRLVTTDAIVLRSYNLPNLIASSSVLLAVPVWCSRHKAHGGWQVWRRARAFHGYQVISREGESRSGDDVERRNPEISFRSFRKSRKR